MILLLAALALCHGRKRVNKMNRARQTILASGGLRSRMNGRGRQGASTALAPYWAGVLSRGNIANGVSLQEISGIDTCRLPANNGKFIVVSDAPANSLTILNDDGSTLGTITLTGANTGGLSDWEENASCWIDNKAMHVVGNFGDNGNARATFELIFWEENITLTGNHTFAQVTVTCQFPGANAPTHKDCEAIIFDAIERKVSVITKRDAVQKVYSLAYQDPATYVGTQTMVYEGAMTSLPSSTTSPLGATLCYAVGATISPDGTEILVKGYDKTYIFPRNIATQTVMQALQQPLVEVVAYCGGGSGTPKKSHPSAEPQGEAVCYTQNGRDLRFASEYLTGDGSSATTFPFFGAARLSRAPTRWEFQQGVAPSAAYTGCQDTTVWDTNPGTNYGADATFTVDTAPGVETDQRKGLLQFLITAIPVGETVVQAWLELYIAVEGQGWKLHKMLIPWTSASTYTSLGGPIDNNGTKAAVALDCQNGLNLDTVQLVTTRNNMNASGIATIQDWVNNPANNNGWLIEQISSATGDGIQFASAEAAVAAQRPKLVVYTA